MSEIDPNKTPEEAQEAPQGSEAPTPQNGTDKPAEAVTGRPKALILLATVGVALAVLAALFVHFVAYPYFVNEGAKRDLVQIASARGPIIATNTNIVTFTDGSKIKDINAEQKALVNKKDEQPVPGFQFSNPNSGERKQMDVYLDLSSQQSRDFLLMNAATLRTMVENGTLNIRIIPVPTGDAFNLYAAEAVAESVYTSPGESWDFLLELARMSATVDTDKAEDLVGMIANTAKELEVKDIDAESIKNGTFISWIASAGNDPRVQTGFYPPLVYVEGKLLDPKQINLNNSEEIRRAVTQGN